jgi:glc operon protein GlcG
MTALRFTLLALITLATLRSAAAQDAKPATPLVTRNRVELNLAGAELILTACQEKAGTMKVFANVAVVDAGGHLLAFARMDGARPASGQTALTKAISAATFRQESGTLPQKGEPDLLLSLGVAMAATASGGKMTPLKGGVPILVDGQVVGAVGVGGGTGEQDAEVAKAGIRALLDRLNEKK